ncbi:Sodium:solute symporter family-domain-containing protein [Zychaea mexicana]|uniref:Sodium:solute symporter family-domain-containing protein n=1 Tax=Zychaea mexicana TaxID=64656 RepID=UPI0022FEF346|nr:Sodium:solute symporter family-domain-containing protein [Zychaea mexicana]KAI9490942.1 Sodium:solute symporter family-domain-containing protein [Zychaea mexicana]
MAVLSQGVGYGVVIGFGALFTALMMALTWMLKRYLYEAQSSEMFSTANRSVKTGLIASAIVSSWTWAATLLTSTEVAYRYGVSGPIWYASGACVQVLLFSVLAIELKRRAPNSHTCLEVVRARYGRSTHFVYLVFALITNIIVTAMLLLGGSAVVSYLTGMHVIAACFLLPLGVIVYTLFGGIKATFLSDYTHTAVILVIILYLVFTVYTSSPHIGSIERMYDLLTVASMNDPITDNAQGSLLTMSSLQALIFGIVNVVGNFGTVFVDNAYWQRAIASDPSHCVKAYLLGGLSWYAIPFTLATTMGLTGRALGISVTDEEITAGLVLPNACVALLGTGGAWVCLLLVFFAVTSAASAELIAVSSIFTYDIFRAYIRPNATDKTVIRFSHISVLSFGVIMGVLATLLNFTGINLGYLYKLMGVLISSAVIPITLTLLWSKQNKHAAAIAPIFGLCCSLTAWLVTTKSLYGEITVFTSNQNYPMLAGNLVALFSPLFIILPLSFIWPENYTFEGTRQIQVVKEDTVTVPAPVTAYEQDLRQQEIEEDEAEQLRLKKSSRFAKISSVCLALSLFILWPMPMFGSQYVFSLPFFRGWVIVGIIWVFFSTFMVGVYPLFEARKDTVIILKAIWDDIRGRRNVSLPKTMAEAGITESNDSVVVEEKKV